MSTQLVMPCRLASYGGRQLQWAARQLSAGRPTVVFLHFPLPLAAVNEAPDLRWPDVVSLLSAHSNIKLVLSFHLHRVGQFELKADGSVYAYGALGHVV